MRHKNSATMEESGHVDTSTTWVGTRAKLLKPSCKSGPLDYRSTRDRHRKARNPSDACRHEKRRPSDSTGDAPQGPMVWKSRRAAQGGKAKCPGAVVL